MTGNYHSVILRVVAEKPVAVRVVRDYETVDEFLDGELETLTRTTVLLVGAQKRPDGVVLRFEITLRSGSPILRGEGRVVGYRENAHQGEPGLLLRFTRLDSKSKALVDKAAERREGRRSMRPPPPPVPSPLPSPPPPPPPPPPTPTSTPSIDIPISVEVEAIQEPPTPPPTPPPPPRAPTFSAPEISFSPASAMSAALAPPPDREAILERLRTRAKSLAPEQIEAILKARAP